ncbi:MAG: hypothetical protein ACK4YU_02500, partial [Paracoccus sp. (in: a-proteobacteria)]
MTEPYTNENDPDLKLDELAYFQKKANSLIAFAVKMGWIEPGDAFYLYGDVAGATPSTIWGIYMTIVGVVDEKRAEYNAT